MHSGGEQISKTSQRGKNVTDRPAQPIGGKSRAFTVFRKTPSAKLPIRANDHAVGWDVFADLLSESGRPITKACHQRAVTPIPSGLVLRPPEGFYFQCCSRSGLAGRGIFVANAPGIIDPDYTGELIILLFNGSFETQYVQHHHRIAQIVLCPIVSAFCEETQTPPQSSSSGRGEKGFGSSGP